MQIVAQGAILGPVSLFPTGRQVLWIQAHLYLADLNSKLAFRLHQLRVRIPQSAAFNLAVLEGLGQDEFLPESGQHLSQKEIS